MRSSPAPSNTRGSGGAPRRPWGETGAGRRGAANRRGCGSGQGRARCRGRVRRVKLEVGRVARPHGLRGEVVVSGAGGGVGTLGIQMLKTYNVEITAVDSADKLDVLRSLGVDHVIDYAKEDYTKNGDKYDLIIDVVAHRSVFDYKRALHTGGVFVVVGGAIPRILQVAFLGSWISKASGKKMGLLMHRPNPEDLQYLSSLYEAGELVPIIDRCFTLNEVPEAMKYFGEGHFVGKIVIAIAE